MGKQKKQNKNNPFRGKEEILTSISGRAAAAWDVLRRSVWPLLVTRTSAGFEHVGSCVLVRLGPVRFVLTAAHVLDWEAHGELSLITGEGLVGLSGVLSRTVLPRSGQRWDDRQDVGFFELENGDEVERSGGVFISPESMDAWERPVYELPDRTHYLALGYPLRKARLILSRGIMEGSSIALNLPPAALGEYARLGRALDTHLLLKHHPKRSYPR